MTQTDSTTQPQETGKTQRTTTTPTTTPTKQKPKFCYIREPKNAEQGKEKRVIVIAMSYDKVAGVGNYGGCIFRRTSPTEVYKKKDLRETAKERLLNKPVPFKLVNPKPEEKIPYSDVVSEIRKTMYTLGVKSKKVKSESMDGSEQSTKTKSKPKSKKPTKLKNNLSSLENKTSPIASK